MRGKARLIALAGVAALVMLVVPSASFAVPHAPIITFPQNAGGYNTSANIPAGSLTVFGTVDTTIDVVTTVTVRLGDPPCPPAGCGFGPILGTDVPDGFGNWAVTITLPEGFHRIYVTAQDITGSSSAALRDFLIDNTFPAPPTIASPLPGQAFTSPFVPISGTGEPRAFLVITDEIGNVRRTTVRDDGLWFYNAIFSPGLHTISAFQQDLARNTSFPSAPVSFSVSYDTTGPPPPTIDTPQEDQVVGPSGIVVSGTTESFATVEVCEDRPGNWQDPPPFMGPECEVSLGMDQADATGVWTMTLPTQPPSQDGLHFIRARATDTNGNVGLYSEIRRFTIDSRAPKVTVNFPDLHVFASPTLLNGSQLSGLAFDNVGLESVRVLVKDLLGDIVADDVVPVGGTFALWTDEPVLNNPMLYTATITAKDLAGNISAPVTFRMLHVI